MNRHSLSGSLGFLHSRQMLLLFLIVLLGYHARALADAASANHMNILFSQTINNSELDREALQRLCYGEGNEPAYTDRADLFAGLACLRLDDKVAAAQHFAALPTGSISYKMGRLVSGDAYLEAGDMTQAIVNWQAAGAAIKLRKLGEQARLAGQLDIAIAASEAGLAVWDEFGSGASVLEKVFLNYNLAWAWASKGALEEAEAAYRRVLALRPNDYRAVVGLGGIYRLKRQFGAAETTLLKATQLAPDRYEAYYHLGLMAIDQQDWHQAKVWFSEALIRAKLPAAQQRIRDGFENAVRHLHSLP